MTSQQDTMSYSYPTPSPAPTSNADHPAPSMISRPQDPFVSNLMKLLMDEKYHSIMRFIPDKEDHFEIIKPHEFVTTILPFHFHLKMWGAFENKLLRYGFQQVKKKKAMTKLELMGYTESTTPHKRSKESKSKATRDSTAHGQDINNIQIALPKEYDDTKMAILTRVMDETVAQEESSVGNATFYHPSFKKGAWDALDQITSSVSRRGQKRKERF